MLTIPVWALPLLLALITAVLGFAWRLAARAERLTDKLEGLVERMGTIESRLAVVHTLETAVTELRAEMRTLRQELMHERELRERLETRVNRVDERMQATPIPGR